MTNVQVKKVIQEEAPFGQHNNIGWVLLVETPEGDDIVKVTSKQGNTYNEGDTFCLEYVFKDDGKNKSYPIEDGVGGKVWVKLAKRVQPDYKGTGGASLASSDSAPPASRSLDRDGVDSLCEAADYITKNYAVKGTMDAAVTGDFFCRIFNTIYMQYQKGLDIDISREDYAKVVVNGEDTSEDRDPLPF